MTSQGFSAFRPLLSPSRHLSGLLFMRSNYSSRVNCRTRRSKNYAVVSPRCRNALSKRAFCVFMCGGILERTRSCRYHDPG